MSELDRPLYGVDAGGSSSSVRAFDGQRWDAPPVNPSSVGHEASARHLSELFGRIRGHADRARQPGGRPPPRPACWLASAPTAPPPPRPPAPLPPPAPPPPLPP